MIAAPKARPPRPDALKARIDPAHFYASEIEGAPLKANGGGWTKNFPCPFHDDKNGSFGVNLETGAFRCFGCGAQGGSVIDFIMSRDGLDLDGARAALADRYGIGADPGTPPLRPRPARQAAPEATLEPLGPIPPKALESRSKAHPTHGRPSETWEYRDPAGRPLFYVLRFDLPEGRKQFAPLTWTEADGWRWRAPPAPRPLYGRDHLAARPEAAVLICEGEKSADAAALLLPECAVVTTMNGAQSPAKSDFGPLAGRRVLIWPDADEPGATYAAKVAELARAAGALSVEVLDLTTLARDPATGEPRDLPEGWDAADALADGWTAATLAGVARWETPAGLQGLHRGCSETLAEQGCIPVSPETLQKYVADQIGPAGPDAAAGHCPDVADDDPRNGMQFSRVAGVAGDTTNNRKGSGCNPDATPGVSGVAGNEPRPIPGAADRPAFRVFDNWTEANKAKFRPGVWFFGTDKDGMLTQTWICSPLYLDAVTFDGQDNNFGRLLRFRNTLGRWRQWAMPMDLLAGLGNEIRGELLAMGVEIDPTTKARALLATYLQAGPPKRRMRAALEVGWCGGSFVLPDAVIGPDAAGVIFQSGERGHDEYTRAGTLEGWRAEVAAPAVGNPMLTMGMSASFAGPLLWRTNAEGGGLHLWGDSSTGKSAILDAACSTWGGPNYRRSWRATANGMEGAASLFNDCLLALDEISECDPREVGAIVYSLGNGRGKQRSSRTGAARSVSRWRCFIVSNGERTIATTMLEGGHRAKAGQGARLLDLPAARTFGAWDDLHDMPNGAAFSDALKRAAVTHHGHAGRAFLERLTRDPRDFAALLDEFKGLPSFAAEAGEGQEKRVAGRFALLALAGELATEYGVTGWPEGEATKAAEEGFRAWGAHRGKGNDERRQILDRVQAFIERHGDARFSAADATGEGLPTRDRAGWWRTTVEGRQYLFTADGMREATRGFDLRRALDVLEAAGALPPAGADGKRAVSQRINGRPMRLYPVAADKLGDCDGD